MASGNIDISQVKTGQLSGGTNAVDIVTTDGSTKTATHVATWDANANLVDGGAAPVPATRTISTTAPLTGGGDLTTDRTLAISNFTGDSGSGGAAGAVPAPAAGDSAAGKYLSAGGTWNFPPGTGTVTSVGLTVPAWLSVSGTPVTGSGTLAVTATSGETANQFLATPNGTTGAVGLRAIVPADLPVATTAALGAVKPDGSTITISAGVISSTCVTSVALTVPAWLSVSGSPVTSSGTLAVTATSGQTANEFLATPNGSSGTVGLRAIVSADLPLATTSASGAVKPDGSTIDIASGVISVPTATNSTLGLVKPDGSSVTISGGILSSSSGFANPMTAQGDLIVGGSGGVATRFASGTSGYVLTGAGTAATPTWSLLPIVIGFVIGVGATGTAIGGRRIAPRAGAITKCKVIVDASDASVNLTFTIKQNGSAIFTSSQTITAGTTAGTLSTITALTSNPLSVAADDIFSIDITSGSAYWTFTAQLES